MPITTTPSPPTSSCEDCRRGPTANHREDQRNPTSSSDTTTQASGAQLSADSAAPSFTLADESEVYFVGIIAAVGDPIAMATVASDLDLYVFNLDEVILHHQFLLGLGDVNLDGVSNLMDVPAFVALLLAPFPDACDLVTVDLNGDGKVDGLDVQLFVDLLT